ncbi:mucin-5AC [Aedes albopictus]|uniref:SEA domain-containing protein n=1 Tax=Aedes albopictus TaxID=7160 RepID=A0ABM1ZBT4_AEDAL
MESIYGTNKNKYMQSLTAGSDFYRCPSTIRPMAADYSSYQNTLGRRSTLMGMAGVVGGGGGGGGGAPYTHMSKYSYPTDVSLSSHYGYTSWGLWRDTRNLSSSMYGKKQKNFRSVSILLMSAAFIVVLAVLCVAALAFYFSAFKADLSDSILVFDCTLRVTRGDIYTTGLRSNSTPVFRQKSAFYERLVDTSLEQSGLTVSRTEIMDFGDGPTIVLTFRVFLDMRKIKITINNVEEHIRQAVLSELANPNSVFKNIRVDPDTIEIKRLLDREVIKTAFLKKEETFPPVLKAPEERYGPAKKSGVIEKTVHKFTAKISTSTVATTSAGDKRSQPRQPQQHQADGESDIDMDNLPVIQGSFEITKTDADITQKRTSATLKPFAVSPAQLKVRNNGGGGGSEKRQNENVKSSHVDGDKVSSTVRPSASGAKLRYETATAKIEKTDKHGSTTKKIKSNSGRSSTSRRTTSTTTTTTMTTPTAEPSTTQVMTTTTEEPTTTTTTTRRTTIKSTTIRSTTPVYEESEELYTDMPINDRNDTLLENFLQAIINDSLPQELAADKRVDENIPKLDVSLFTSAPILDKQPWQPIRPTIPKGIPVHKFNPPKPTKKKSTLAEEILYRTKQSDIESSLYTESPSVQVYYQSFTNPSFGSSTLGIEPLGMMDVRPYPLPVDKISLQPVPDFKQMTPTAISIGENLMNMTLDEKKFEHLGGGVIAKKPENKTTPYRTTTEAMKTSVITVTPVYVERTSQNLIRSTEEYVEYYQVDGLNYTEMDTTTTVMDDFNDTSLDYSLGVESRISPDEEVYTTEVPVTSTMENVEKLTEVPFDFGTSESLVTTTDLPEVETTTTSTTELFLSSTETTTEEPKTTTSSKRSTFVEVETLKYNPTTSVPTASATVPELFPINKWEFVNGSRVTPSNRQSTRKVFNETLQALIVENIQAPTTAASVKIEDLKSKRNTTTNLQNLSAIFDTLASKLGIQTETSSKLPPFSSLSKIKNQYKSATTRLEGATTKKRTRNPTRPKRKKNKNTNRTSTTTSTSTTEIPTTLTTTTPRTTTTTPLPPITTPFVKLAPTVINEDIGDVMPVMLAPASPEYSAEYYPAGQAEVEVIDPNQYEEMLRLLAATPSGAVRYATTTPIPLVTLMPAKSNSGIKNFRPKVKLQHQSAANSPLLLTSSSLAAHNQRQSTAAAVAAASSDEGRKMSESLKLMNANNGRGDNVGWPPSSMLSVPSPVVVSNGGGVGIGGIVGAEAAPLMAESAGQGFDRDQNDNKNNTIVEAVVRASMRFES